MKAWGALPGDDPKRDRAETEAAIVAAGIDLDPSAPGHMDDHPHPHHQAKTGETPYTGIVGAGAVGTALGVALSRAGWPIHAIASRDATRRERFSGLVDGARGFAEPQALIEEVELIIVAIPDDAIEPLARSVRMYSGQAMVHTSGALGADVLEPAMAAGTQVGVSPVQLDATEDRHKLAVILPGYQLHVAKPVSPDRLVAAVAQLASAPLPPRR